MQDARKMIKRFPKSYIYVKKHEEDYGMQFRNLCLNIEKLFVNITAPLCITNSEERRVFPQKLVESYF